MAELAKALDLRNAVHIGHSTGGGEVTRYVAQHGKGRVAKAVLISAIPPAFIRSERNPEGVPREVVDGLRDGTANHRSQFYKDITIPFYGYNRPGATISEGIRENWWRQGMMGSIKAQYDCIKALSETEFYDDLAVIDVPVLVMHGEDDQICPFPLTGAKSVTLLKHGTLKSYPGSRTACPQRMPNRSTPTCWPLSRPEGSPAAGTVSQSAQRDSARTRTLGRLGGIHSPVAPSWNTQEQR